MLNLEESLAELKMFQRKSKSVDEVRRSSMIMYHFSGFSIEETALFFGYDEKTVKAWVDAYKNFGLPGLKKKSFPAAHQNFAKNRNKKLLRR